MKGERSFFLFFLFSFFSVFFFSLSVRTSLENAFASTHGRQCILICSSYNSTDHGCKTRISCDRDHEGDEGVVRLARVVRGGFASGKRKRFSRVSKRGRGAKEERNFGNDSGRKPRTAARVRIRRQPLACETTDTTELAEDEARFAAGLKVPRCVTRLLGAELMPPSE